MAGVVSQLTHAPLAKLLVISGTAVLSQALSILGLIWRDASCISMRSGFRRREERKPTNRLHTPLLNPHCKMASRGRLVAADPGMEGEAAVDGDVRAGDVAGQFVAEEEHGELGDVVGVAGA